jgi:2-keto-3-deoxy-L-rhamnonate aldolase RhmA
MLDKNYLIEKLKSGKPVLGTWAMIPSTVNIDIIASTGVDFIIIDREHGPINFETAQDMAIACSSRGVSPIMRVGDIEKSFIQNALDIGMHGIQVPNIDTEKNARDVVHYSKYPPIGDRGFSPFTRAGNYSIESAKLLTSKANENTAVILNIEGQDAVKNFDDILKVNHADIFFVGLFDLSKSLGIPGEVSNPLVMEALKVIISKANKVGKYVGTIATSEDKIVEFLEIGVKYIVYLVDCEILRSGYASAVKKFKLEKLK